MRRVCAVLAVVTAAITGADATPRFVNLNKPGAMAQLERDNPAHHRTVREILGRVREQPDWQVEAWLRVTYKAEDVSYYPILLASNPPKRHLSFRLDDVLYEIRLTLPYAEAVAEPAQSNAPRPPR